MPVSELWDVLRRPLITEKGTILAESRQYLFEVHIDSTKAQIKSAVEKAFGVKVDAVNVSTVHGKMRRWKRWSARRPDWKKAVVTLKVGEKLDLFEL